MRLANIVALMTTLATAPVTKAADSVWVQKAIKPDTVELSKEAKAAAKHAKAAVKEAAEEAEDGASKSEGSSSWDAKFGGGGEKASVPQKVEKESNEDSGSLFSSVSDGANKDYKAAKKSGSGVFASIGDFFSSIGYAIEEFFESGASIFKNAGDFLKYLPETVVHPGRAAMKDLKENPQALNDLASAMERNQGATHRMVKNGIYASADILENDPNIQARGLKAARSLMVSTAADIEANPTAYGKVTQAFLNSGVKILETKEGQAAMTRVVKVGVQKSILENKETKEVIGKAIMSTLETKVPAESMLNGEDKVIVLKMNESGAPQVSVENAKADQRVFDRIVGKTLADNFIPESSDSKDNVQLKRKWLREHLVVEGMHLPAIFGQ